MISTHLCLLFLRSENSPYKKTGQALLGADTSVMLAVILKRKAVLFSKAGKALTMRAVERIIYPSTKVCYPYPGGDNDHRMAKSIDDSIDFAAKRQVWQRMIL